MISKIWRNGVLFSESCVADRGFLYGDGFFTTMLCVNGRLANWNAHWERLQQSAKRLGFPYLDKNQIQLGLQKTFQACEAEPFEVVKLIVTRGEGGVGYQPLAKPSINYYIQRVSMPKQTDLKPNNLAQKYQAWYFSNPKLIQSDVRWGHQPMLAGLKHLNRLENVLARQALLDLSADEAIMLDLEGNVISATQANLVMIKNATLIMPKLDQCGVLGTCSSSLTKALNASQWQFKTQKISMQDLLSAQEIFLCNAVRGIMPVTLWQGKQYANEQTLQIYQAWIDWQLEHLTDIEHV